MNARLLPPVKIDDCVAIPQELVEQLAVHRQSVLASVCTETLVRGGPLTSIAHQLAQHLRSQRVLGYHCTREPEPGYFRRRGLRPTNLREHQDEFLQTFGHRFTSEEVDYMRQQWHAYFDAAQKNGREGRVWTCLTRASVLSSGMEPFFAAYGGEAIHMPLADDSSAKAKLATLGQPVVVEVALPGDEIQTYCEMAWCTLNYFHRTVNPRAYPMESEACFKGTVQPSDVLAVVPLSEFRC